MKIFLTGGSGHIGRNLKRLLTNKGHVVCAPSHTELDLLNRDAVDQYIRYGQFDAAINAAGKGGRRGIEDTFENTYVPNIQMYENLGLLGTNRIPLILFGSGAEYDRRFRIRDEYASSAMNCWPIDPYGLSKNVITRRALNAPCSYILRLFGCFNHDEDDTRFIKSCILSVKENSPITIHQNKEMDFFYLDDIVPIIERIFEDIKNPHWPEDVRFPKNINLTYTDKHTLLDVAKLVISIMNKPDHQIIYEPYNNGLSYTGWGWELKNRGVVLAGLNEGIRRTISELT